MAATPAVSVEYYLRLALFVVVWVSLIYWMHSDATARGGSRSSALFWGIGTVVFIPIGAYYLLSYRRSHERDIPQTRYERATGILAVSGIVASIASVLLTPPDPLTQLQFIPAAFGVTVLASSLLDSRIRMTGSAN
jgi:hypothetical protein